MPAAPGATRIPLHINPFFDHEDPLAAPKQLKPTIGELGPDSYGDPAQTVMSDGRMMSSVAGSGPSGLRGLVIPRATAGGVPAGVHPHQLQDIEVTIDPQVPGQSTTLRLGDLTGALMKESMELAAESTPAPNRIETQRLRAAAAFIAAGNTIASRRGPGSAAVAAPPIPRTGTPTNTLLPGSPHSRRSGSPLAAFDSPPAPPPAANWPETFPAENQVATPVAPAPPTVVVHFELEHMGEIDAHYHDVMVQPGMILLVYDMQFKFGTVWFPKPPADPEAMAPRLALEIELPAERGNVYMVQVPGIEYDYGGKHFCQLLIERKLTVPLE